MIFDKLAEFIHKHHKILAGIWLLAFVIGLIFAMGLMEQTETEQTAFLPNVESMKVAEIIETQFPSEAKTNAIIVIEADDIRDPAIEAFTRQTIAEIQNSSDIAYLIEESIFSPYSLEDFYVKTRNETQEMIAAFYPLLWWNISRSAFYLHNKTDAFGGVIDIPNDVQTVQNWTENIDSELITNTYFSMNSTGTWTYITDLLFHNMAFLTLNYTMHSMYIEMGGESTGIPYKYSIGYLLLQSFNNTWGSTFSNMVTGSLYHSYDNTSIIFANASQYMVLGQLMSIATIGKETAWQTAKLMSETVYNGPQFPTKDSPSGSYPIAAYENFVSTKPGTENKTLIFMFGFSESTETKGILENVEVIREIVQNNINLLPNDAKVYVSGDLAMEIDLNEASEEDVRRIDVITIGLVFLLLTAVFLSIVTPAVPLVTIGMGIVIAQGILFGVSTITTVPTMILSIVTVLMMGAGVDYCIFIMSRYKEERENGVDKDESVKTAIKWAGESVFSSGMTVAVGFGSLLTSTFLLVRMMAVGPLVGIGVCLVAAITVIPASLFMFGDKLYWPKKLDNPDGEEIGSKSNFWKRLMNNKKEHSWLYKPVCWVVDHPKTVIIVFLIVCSPFIWLSFNVTQSYDFLSMMPGGEKESVQGMDIMMDGYSLGKTMPTQVLVSYNTKITLNQNLLEDIDDIAKTLENLPFVDIVKSYTRPEGIMIDYMNPDSYTQSQMTRFYSELNDKSTFLIEVFLNIEPMDIEALEEVDGIREIVKENAPEGSRVLVGGATAMYNDMRHLVQKDEPLWVAIVIIGVFIVLLFLLGSVFTPIRLEFTILVSVLSALGMTEFVFGVVQGKGIPWMVPIMLFVLLFGLGMDYDIFIVTRMREEVLKGKSDKEAIVTAIDKTGTIITSCGIIMAGAFGSLMLSSGLMFQTMGFAFAMAIILDATVVRIFLVPAIMVLMERWNWWAPGPLQRVRRE
ncbi:MAG: MMPL family transporter [Candidatus Hodarchaeota archaeon]